MVQTIKISNGDTLHFPDEMSDEHIKAAIHKEYGASTKSPEKSGADFDPSFLEKLAPNVLTGLATMGHNVINSPHNIAKLFSEKLANKIPKQQEHDYAGLLKLPKEATLADKIVRGAAQYAPAMALPELGLGGEAAGMAAKMAGNAIPQAAFGATQTENPLEGAAGGAVAGAAAPIIGAGVNALRPSRLFRGNLSKQELANNLEATKGTNTALGRVVESPTLNRIFENVLPHVIGSGSENAMQKTANAITNKGSELLNKIKGEMSPENFGEQLRSALKKASKEASDYKNTGYATLNKAADEAGIKIGRKNFKKSANNAIEDIKLSPELMSEFSPELFNDLTRYAANKEGNNLKLTNIFRGKLNDKASEFYENGKRYEHGLVKSLINSLDKDIDSAFKNSSDELVTLYHGKNKNSADRILKEGLRSPKYSEDYALLTNKPTAAQEYSSRRMPDSDEPGEILKIQIPKSKINEYLHMENKDKYTQALKPRGEGDAQIFGIKKIIPPKYIKGYSDNHLLETPKTINLEEILRNKDNKLQNLYKKTQKEYGEKFKPFEDKDIVKFTRQGGDPDLLLSHFLKGGKNDRSTILTKLIEKLPEESKHLPLYAHLSKAVDENGEVNPIKLSGLYRSLGENQKKALFKNEETRNDFKNYSKLVGMNKETFDLMRNPKTGARNTELLSKMMQGLVGYGAGGIPGVFASLVASGLVGRLATNKLTSEKVRESLIKKMMENKTMKIPGGRAAKALSAPLLTMELNKYKGREKNGN
jgi:hypothetical protein